MTINFERIFDESIETIDHSKYHEINIKDLESYGDAKWAIVDLLNDHYSSVLTSNFDLYNWINHNEKDEVAYFLNETGSNVLNYSEFGAPAKFHLWLGEKGFIIGIEQKGNGFNAFEIDKFGLKENEGAGFNFFRECKSQIFFDNVENVKIVFMKYLIKEKD